MNIYVHGRESTGWSVDADHAHIERFIRSLGHRAVSCALWADRVHSVYWEQLLSPRSFFVRRKKKIIATASHLIAGGNEQFHALKKSVSLWIAPSSRQQSFFSEQNVPCAFQPFYCDETVFRKTGLSRNEIMEKLGIPRAAIEDRIIIGSFQRDTLGSDLRSPKQQKGPDILADILSKLPDPRKWILLLAGPRRHYLIGECERRGIPYYFYGRLPEPGKDDMRTNVHSAETMALLYALCDCYLVTSRSEGGPKAVIESGLCGTPILSSDVGCARDILRSECVFDTIEKPIELLSGLVRDGDGSFFSRTAAANYENARKICSFDAARNRWKEIYERL